MQISRNHAIAVPLGSDISHRECGAKAFAINRLVNLGFDVPDGFTICADAYRAHLWQSGARVLAYGKPDSKALEKLRRAILDTDPPEEVISAIKAAYRAGAVVAVRHSASDEETAGTAYETVLGVSGVSDLIDTVKVVWASLWSEEAAALREESPQRSEPLMSVIVQQMVDARSSGVVTTANPTTGNPNEVVIDSVWGVRCSPGPADIAVVDLRDFRISSARAVRKDTAVWLRCTALEPDRVSRDEQETLSLSHAEIVRLAETAIWIENSLDGRAGYVINWAHDGQRFQILGAKPAGGLPRYFPASEEHERFIWQLVGAEPVSRLARNLIELGLERMPKLLSAGKTMTATCWNGRVYKRLTDADKRPGKLGALCDVIAGVWFRRTWAWTAKTITDECRCDLSVDPFQLTNEILASTVDRAIERAIVSFRLFEAASYLSVRFAGLLRWMLKSADVEPGVFSRLISGSDRSRIEKDRLFQRLAAYSWQSATDPEENPTAAEMTRELTDTLGCAFVSPADAYDPASWKSWAENPDYLAQTISALSRGPMTDASVAASDSDARVEAACGEAFADFALSRGPIRLPFTKIKFRILLRCARAWAAAAGERHQVHALALTALRVSLLELGRRLEASGVLSVRDDIFHLEAAEIRDLRTDLDEPQRVELRRKIAERKHELWLESRLSAPAWSPEDAEPIRLHHWHRNSRILLGTPLSGGEVIGFARIATSPEEASALRPGEILVTEELSPAWTPFLGLAAAVVVASGNVPWNEPLAALDYRIPCVAGVADAISKIRTGCTIRVDGSAGQVEIVSRGQVTGNR